MLNARLFGFCNLDVVSRSNINSCCPEKMGAGGLEWHPARLCGALDRTDVNPISNGRLLHQKYITSKI